MEVLAIPLTQDAFAPYGDVLTAPAEPGRTFFDGGLATLRPAARPSLSVALIPPLTTLPLVATRMERHAFSSQSFIPLDVSRYLVIVAPKNGDGGPDATKARVFLAGPDQGITYRADTWHHPMTVLDRPARFAISMWLDGSTGDEEFATLKTRFTIRLPETGGR